MARPRIAIVGSVDETRMFEPPVREPAVAREACEQLGRELAEAGWDIVVYSADPEFIEADVVRGYTASGKAEPLSIHVHSPHGKGRFAEAESGSPIFDERWDPSRDWEVSFYRSLRNCDGVLLVGGGRSTLNTGVVALTMGLPVVALAAFGGNAKRAWEHLNKDSGGATDDDIAEMAKSWQHDSARRLVQGLVRQRQAKAARQQEDLRLARRTSRRALTSLFTAAVLLFAAAAAIPLVWDWRPGTAGSIGALVLIPTLAGAAGALIRTSLDVGQEWVRAGVLGGAAGLITGLLYVASQLVGAPDVLGTDNAEGVRRLLFFVLPIGFIAGLTFDAVYTKLRTTDVSRTSSVTGS